MDRLLLVGLTLAFLGVSVSGQLYDDWITEVDVLGGSVSFQCIVDGIHPKEENLTGFEVVEWMLPSRKRLAPGDILGSASVDPIGWNITIKNITTSDFGVYHCMMQDQSSTWRLVKWGLNMKGPYFEDLIQKYTKNMIIGFSAFGGFLLIVAVVILVYKFRWQAPEEDQAEDDAQVKPMESYPAYYNNPPAPVLQRSESLKAAEAAAVASLAAATAGEPDIPGTVPEQEMNVMDEKSQPAQREQWVEPKVEGYSNPAATGDDGSKLVNTNL